MFLIIVHSNVVIVKREQGRNENNENIMQTVYYIYKHVYKTWHDIEKYELAMSQRQYYKRIH